MRCFNPVVSCKALLTDQHAVHFVMEKFKWLDPTVSCLCFGESNERKYSDVEFLLFHMKIVLFVVSGFGFGSLKSWAEFRRHFG